MKIIKIIQNWIRKAWVVFQNKDTGTQSDDQLQSSWFDACNVGDVIWARMPLSEAELNRIEPTHRVRPYFIIFKTNTTLIGKSCSSKAFVTSKEYHSFCLEKNQPLPKRTWIDLRQDHVVPIKNLMSSPYPISQKELRRIQKNLVLISVCDAVALTYLPINVQWEKGDIILCDHVYWYLLDYSLGSLQVIRLYEAFQPYMDDAGWGLLFNAGKCYYAQFSDVIHFNGKLKMRLVGRATQAEIDYVDRCVDKKKQQRIQWRIGYVLKRKEEALILLNREPKYWFCLCWHKYKNKWYCKSVYDLSGFQCTGRVSREKLLTLIPQAMKEDKDNYQRLLLLYQKMCYPLGLTEKQIEAYILGR